MVFGCRQVVALLVSAASGLALAQSETPAPAVRSVVRPAVAVPPVRIEAPAAMPGTSPPSAVAPPLPPLAIPSPTVINNCDATGCWDNLGTRLQQVGPMLSGPRGLCSVQGSFVSCP